MQTYWERSAWIQVETQHKHSGQVLLISVTGWVCKKSLKQLQHERPQCVLTTVSCVHSELIFQMKLCLFKISLKMNKQNFFVLFLLRLGKVLVQNDTSSSTRNFRETRVSIYLKSPNFHSTLMKTTFLWRNKHCLNTALQI